MQGFTRIIPKKGHESWMEKLANMSDFFHRIEYETVKVNYRKAAIIDIYSEDIRILEKTNKDGLIFTPLEKRAHSLSFSSVIKEPESGQPFFWRGCLTRNYKDGENFKTFYLNRDDKSIGQMLGYPDCCIDYFAKTFPVDPVPIWLDLSGKINGYPECNGLLRYFGAKILPHLTCSPLCKKSEEMGKKWFKLMQETDKNLAKDLYNLLAGPITWNSYHGVVQIETPYFIGLNNAIYLQKKPRIITWKGPKKELKNNHSKKKIKK